ncbi:MAG: hypothetical protein ABSG13_29270 [Bryobacteraceae bacterium]
MLDSVGDNFKRFLQRMNDLGGDCGCKGFDASVDQFPKGFEPFKEISDYRDNFLHNPVIARGIGEGKTYIPRWKPDKYSSPLEQVKESWRAAEQLSPDDLISTTDLLQRLIYDACATLEKSWQRAIAVVTSQAFEQKMVGITGLARYLPLSIPTETTESVYFPVGHLSLGSNTTFAVSSASGNYPFGAASTANDLKKAGLKST